MLSIEAHRLCIGAFNAILSLNKKKRKKLKKTLNGITPVQYNIVTNILTENNCLAPPILKIKNAVLGSVQSNV